MALMLNVVIEDRCVLEKWPRWIVIGRYCYKSSFGAKNDRPGDDGTLRSVYRLVFLLGVIDPASASAFHDILHFMTFYIDILWHFLTFNLSWRLTFHDIWHFTTFDSSWHFAFHDILHFMTFDSSWHLAFHDIWHFMTFDISWHLTFHDIWHLMTFRDILHFM